VRRFGVMSAALTALLALGAGSARASVLFSDDFNDEARGLNVGLKNFTVSGSIDVIGQGTGFNFYPGNGLYVDLDGTGYRGTPASVLTSKTTFGPGTYTVSFDLGGNHRGDGDKTTTVTLGDTSQTYTLASGSALQTYTFTATVSSTSSLIFTEDDRADNIGNVLDNVSVATMSNVPLPSAAPMFGAALVALGAAGFGLRRRKAAA
jgi:hypothetical protein